jgi:hypothetical protein
MALYALPVGLGPPYPYVFPDTDLPVIFRNATVAEGTVTRLGIFSCEIDNSEISNLLQTGRAEWYFESIDGRLSVQILES